MIKLSKKRIKLVPVIMAIALMTIQVIMLLELPNLTSDMVNKGIVRNDTDFIWQTGMKMLGTTAIFVAAAVGNVFFASRVSQRLGKILRNDIYEKVLKMSRHEYNQFSTASMITRTTNDVTQIQNVSIMSLRMMIQAPIMLIGASIMAYQKESRLTSIFLISVPVMLVVVGTILFFATPLFKSLQSKTDKLNLVFREGLTGVRVVRAFRQDDFEQNRFDEANTDYTSTAKKVFTIVALTFPLMTLIMSGTNIGITWNGAHLIGSMDMEIGNLIAFITYAMQILMSFMMLSMVFFLIPRAQASATRINEILDTETDLIEPSNTKSLKTNGQRTLSFKNIQFDYADAEEPVLSGVNAEIKQGQTLAIIGGTGSGKTSLINLIPRLYDATKGEVEINGVNVKDVAKDELQNRVSLVPQKAVLFKGTVKSNLLYGNPSASDDELWKALEIAQAADFVRELDGQLEGVVEQGGDNFSGGQKQRLAIARALVKNADIYIFDDSFSALDFKTDATLRQALKNDSELKNKILVIVGQRVSTIADADQIIVLEDGKMVGLGTHQELKQNNTTYQEIVNSQIREGDQG